MKLRMRLSAWATELHARIDWNQRQDLRQIDRLGERCLEVLKGARMVNNDTYISAAEIHDVLYIQAGKRFASTPSNISTALKNFDGRIERRHLDGALKFRFPVAAQIPSASTNGQIDSSLLRICDRFHRATAHLASRRKGKHVINLSDEYDVQDVFGTIVKCYYDDVRDEEWTPSYAGGAARIDFVIRDTKTAAELKRARPAQAIADELILDIARYSKSSEVNKLVCFVYDPDGLLRRDAAQIEIDLSGYREHNGKGLDVVVLIRPK